MALTLAASDTIAASATSASTVNCSMFGDEVTSSGDAYQCLYQGQLGSSVATIYTSPAATATIISSIILFNTNATTAQTVSLYRGGTGSSNQLVSLGIPAGGFAVYESGQGWQIYTASGVQVSPAALGSVSSYLTATVAVSASTNTNVASVALTPGYWLICGTAFAHLTTATLGHMDWWLGPNSASTTGYYVTTTTSMGDVAGGTEEDSVQLITYQTLTANTTVYLECYASEATTIEYETTEQALKNCSGILALQLAA